MSPILKIDNLTKQYRIRMSGKEKVIRALDDVSFCMNEKEKIGIIGPSGCGKTTLLKLVLGLIKPTSGSITKDATVGFVSQDPYASLCQAMRVDEIIAEPLIYSKKYRHVLQAKGEVWDAMRLVELDYDVYAKRYPHQLSGGERQRISIARAIISKPNFLALDEPTSMVDYEVKQGIGKVIKRASKAVGSAVLLVTHDIMFAKDVCDTMFVMDSGKIIEHASTDEILGNARHEQTKQLILAGTDLKAYWKLRQG